MPTPPTTKDQKSRGYAAGHFVLELDGKKEDLGLLSSVDGGWMKSEIMSYQHGNSHELWRQIGKPKCEPFKIEFSMSFSDEFYKWIEAFFTGKVVRRNGAIVAGDFHFNERARRSFYNALINEITIPSLGKAGASDAPPFHMQATITPEIMRFDKPTGEKLSNQTGRAHQKLWSIANFELAIDGPDGITEACRRCLRIDSFTIKQQIHEYHSGEFRDPIQVPGRLEYPNISFYLTEADSAPFINRYTKFGINGELQTSRMTGEIKVTSNDGGELLSISLDGIEVAGVSGTKSEVATNNIKETKVEISVESLKFNYQPAALD